MTLAPVVRKAMVASLPVKMARSHASLVSAAPAWVPLIGSHVEIHGHAHGRKGQRRGEQHRQIETPLPLGGTA